MRTVGFRVDSSIQIGSGHVMRCLTLADSLQKQGAKCSFICRELDGNLIELVCSRGYEVYTLPKRDSLPVGLEHSSWLGATQEQDAVDCVPIIEGLKLDLLIVDHYALDARWENHLGHLCKKLMVIDDLADRPHVCDLLLDQTFNRNPVDYIKYVSSDCRILAGSEFALIRPEFASFRKISLNRRSRGLQLKRLLIMMGGIDKDNITTRILEVLCSLSMPGDCFIKVILGPTAPWLTSVKQKASLMPWVTDVLVGIDNMAEVMAESDLSICASGGTLWECCCLGLPTIGMVTAKNQLKVAEVLEETGAVRFVNNNEAMFEGLCELINMFVKQPEKMLPMVQSASTVIDGGGAARISGLLRGLDWC